MDHAVTSFRLEILEIIGLLISTFLYQLPLNIWLMNFNKRRLILSTAKSFAIILLSWIVYRYTIHSALADGQVPLLLSLLVLINASFYWVLLRFGWQKEMAFKEGRIWGWILFSPILAIPCLISAPLFAALLKNFFNL